jgi:hypothetical protein
MAIIVMLIIAIVVAVIGFGIIAKLMQCMFDFVAWSFHM